MVRFEAWRLLFWAVVSVGLSLLAARTAPQWTRWYADIVEGLLGWAGVPFSSAPGQGVWLTDTPGWNVPSYNPVAQPLGALLYFLTSGLLLAAALRLRWLSFPARAWIGFCALLLLLSTLVLVFRPVPRLTPESFSRLWTQVALGTVFLLPWLWALLVGLLPIPLPRVFLWGISATIVLFVWSACRLALCLALAEWGGVVLLPPAFILGCSLPDMLVMVTAYSLALEASGQRWGGGE